MGPSTERMARTTSVISLWAGFFIFGISNGGRRGRRDGCLLFFSVSNDVKSALRDHTVAPTEQRPLQSRVRVRHQQGDMERFGKNGPVHVAIIGAKERSLQRTARAVLGRAF